MGSHKGKGRSEEREREGRSPLELGLTGERSHKSRQENKKEVGEGQFIASSVKITSQNRQQCVGDLF